MKFVFLYLVIVNYIAFSLFHLDKERAIKGKRRISEKNLLSVVAFGGTLGAWIGMNRYRHKTKKISFKLFHLNKVRTMQCRRRILEENLHSVVAFDVTLGAWKEMNRYQHKNKKISVN